VKILIDMNLSPTWVPLLGQNGFPAAHWSALGSASAADSEIMAYAAADGFVIFTHDLDFGTTLALTHATGPRADAAGFASRMRVTRAAIRQRRHIPSVLQQSSCERSLC